MKSPNLIDTFGTESDLYATDVGAVMDDMNTNTKEGMQKRLDDMAGELGENGMPAKLCIELQYKYPVSFEGNDYVLTCQQGLGTEISAYTFTEGSMPQNVRKHVLRSTNKVNIIVMLSGILNGLLFWYYDAPVMFWYNVLMMIEFVYACICLKKGKIMRYILLVFLGLFFYMIFSVVFLGWDFGFQHYSIGLAASLIFTDYYLYREKKLTKRSIYMASAVVLIYIGLRIWTYYCPYIYYIDNEVLVRGLYILNSVVGFSFMIMYLCIYSNTVRRLEYELLDMANIDPLTGISNRRKMHEMLKLAFGDGENKKMCAAIAMLDIDFFKKVNDTYGHEAGDEVLVTLADILNNKQKENSDFHVCRWGGEEFLLLYEGQCKNYSYNRTGIL